ncbi:cytochrome c [Acetobacteraceae bacterium H6797]|nr:cytochrome c [Acetobacteraceae bacterium H6797]
MKTMKQLLLAAGLVAGLAATLAGPAFAEDEQAVIARGAYLARAGDCVACHTAPGGKEFAGGLAIESNLGKIFSTNITPDRQSGIGGYTEAQFAAALRDGKRADGANLYPAMPYPSYAKLTDEDVHALYVYFMKGVQPVASAAPETRLSFPFNLRFGLAFWNFAFGNSTRFQPNPQASDEINRGAYLVEGLGHCGSCHTPRGFAMQEQGYTAADDSYLAGGDLNGWVAPSLRGATGASRGFSTWTVEEIVDYLGSGRNNHAAVGGEMKMVVEHSLGYLNDADLKAMAVYLKSIATGAPQQPPSPERARATADRLTAAVNLSEGERLYLDNCGACHFVTGQGDARVFPKLDGNSIINASNPLALVSTILAGAATPSTDRSPSILPMPGFASRLSDNEVAALATFLRTGWSNNAPAVSAGDVAAIRARMTPAH